MELHSGSLNQRNRVDYFVEMEQKNLKHLEERLDSGLDSLAEDEYQKITEEMNSLLLTPSGHQKTPANDFEPWKEEVTEDGDTYLHLAVIHESQHEALQIIKQCENEPFLNKHNHQRQTALHLAVITEQALLVEKLLKAGGDPCLVDQNGNTPLHIACRRGSLTCFSILTQINTQHLRSILSMPNYSGHTCLHIAAIHGYLSLVESLVQLGADINAKEQCSGRTSLHLAVDLQNLPLVNLLILLGADVNSVTYGGHVPYHLTFGRHDDEIRRQLHQRTAAELREPPESESEDEQMSEDECGYDDIHFNGM